MPTKILVVETPSFQLGANAGETAERLTPETFPARLSRHEKETAAGGTDTLFVLAPSDLRHQNAFADAANGASSVSLCYFASTQDAIRFLPSLLLFAGGDRPQGVKSYLQKESTIYSESLFSAAAVGTKLDPCFAFSRERLTGETATNSWGCLQALVFLGLQNLPENGEKGTGEKIDIQIGADEKVVAFTVRFDAAADRLPILRGNAILTLPRFSAGVIETRFIESSRKIEFTCIFFRAPGSGGRTIEIVSYHRQAELENAADVKSYTFKTFGSLGGEAPAQKKIGGGFKKKFSDHVRVAGGGPAEPEAVTKVSGGGTEANTVETIRSDSPAPYSSVVVSGKASLVFDKETIFKNENAANRVIELENQVRSLEANLKTREEALAKATKDLSNPLAKRDVITNIKDTQSEGLKQNVQLLQQELDECKKREKELMKMVDKAVQMKDDAAKKIKELDVKLKQASGGQSSKVQMLEKQIEEQKRQNKELSARITELTTKLKAA